MEELNKITNPFETRKTESWFSTLLDNVELSTTLHISKEIPNVNFRLLKQEEFETHVLRTIGFFIDGKMICQATNKVEKNEIVNDWIKNHPTEPFGRIFQNRNTHRELISKTATSRKYKITGDINAEIEEDFYPYSKEPKTE